MIPEFLLCKRYGLNFQKSNLSLTFFFYFFEIFTSLPWHPNGKNVTSEEERKEVTKHFPFYHSCPSPQLYKPALALSGFDMG
jgi:hypothetical protein